nr:uncharacterized protein LOC126055254 [Helicoverpa armigera]
MSPTVHPISPVMKPQRSDMKTTSHDLFGSDSDDDREEIAASNLKAPRVSSSRKIEKESGIDINEPNNELIEKDIDIHNPSNELIEKEIDIHDPNNELIICKKCQIELPKTELKYHLRTNVHKSNSLVQSHFNNIFVIASAFKNRIITYRLNPAQGVEYCTPEAFLCENTNDVLKLIHMSLLKNTCVKINFELFAHFVLPKTSEQQLKSFNTKYKVICNNTILSDFYSNAIELLKCKMSEFEHKESGWSFKSVSHLEINVNKYCPMRGGTYLELPKKLKNSKSCINIQNNDNCCFLWSVVASLYPVKKNVCRTNSYPHYSSIFNIEGMSFPVSYEDIKLFETNNNISINVYGVENKSETVTGPLYLTNKRRSIHVNLLYLERKGMSHYCLIKDLARLVRGQVTNHKGNFFLCESCLQFYSCETKYRSHICSKTLSILPDKNSKLGFKNYERKQKINYVIYADFESLLVNCFEKKSENTHNLKKHQPSCFAYYICCSHDPRQNRYVTYRGLDCVEVFITRLIEDVKKINDILLIKKQMIPLTKKEQTQYNNASTCHICDRLLLDDKVRDHDHVTGKYRGPAHTQCNLMFRVCPFIPVIFHNLSNYDSHLFIKELAKHKGHIKIIPKTKEKYLTITKYIDHDNSNRPVQIKFIDSFQFLSSSLDALSKSLTDKDFLHLSTEMRNDNLIYLLKTKGIYPYDYMNTWKKYEETKLPPKEFFYNTLKMEHITDEEYKHAKTVWDAFKITTIGEYTDLYLKCDVLLLCDIFENFRNISLKYYKLDPAYYVTAPSLSWDAMLLYTQVELDLIDDLEMYQMLEKGIRGGLAQCSLRHAKANNKYLPEFNDLEPSSYLIYLDCNNLYGYAMTKKFPITEFRFLNQKEVNCFDVMSISDESQYGFILEVDLEYPEHVHDFHSDLPFAPEKFIPPGGKTAKLIANLYDKFNYVIHYTHLQECLKNGLVLRKIHRILTFRQEEYLKKYIDLNTSLRQASTTTFEKDFFKLLNNSIFGKTIENKRKQVDIKLATKWVDVDNITNKQHGAEKLICKPNFKSVSVFSENLVAVQLKPEKIFLDRPIYIGFSVLEYAKLHLYQYHYNMKKKYMNNIRLCYTDTDSLLYLIYTKDIYSDIKNNLKDFDTSNFHLDNPYLIPRINEKVPGLFKDELGGDVITEFTGLRAKLYCLLSSKVQIKKQKVFQNQLQID